MELLIELIVWNSPPTFHDSLLPEWFPLTNYLMGFFVSATVNWSHAWNAHNMPCHFGKDANAKKKLRGHHSSKLARIPIIDSWLFSENVHSISWDYLGSQVGRLAHRSQLVCHFLDNSFMLKSSSIGSGEVIMQWIRWKKVWSKNPIKIRISSSGFRWGRCRLNSLEKLIFVWPNTREDFNHGCLWCAFKQAEGSIIWKRRCLTSSVSGSRPTMLLFGCIQHEIACLNGK